LGRRDELRGGVAEKRFKRLDGRKADEGEGERWGKWRWERGGWRYEWRYRCWVGHCIMFMDADYIGKSTGRQWYFGAQGVRREREVSRWNGEG
jgi:hypothetical protein